MIKSAEYGNRTSNDTDQKEALLFLLIDTFYLGRGAGLRIPPLIVKRGCVELIHAGEHIDMTVESGGPIAGSQSRTTEKPDQYIP